MFSDSKSSKGLDLRIVFLVYLGMAVVAMLWSSWGQGGPFYSWTSSEGLEWLDLPTGALIVFAYLVLAQIATQFFEWGRQIEKILSHLLTPLSYFQILLISLMSGFAEEWFFRGVLFSHFGMVVSSLIFGACHFIPGRKLWIWSLWSFAAGIFFCLILRITGSLLLCALIHSAVNASGLILLNRKAVGQPSFRSLS